MLDGLKSDEIWIGSVFSNTLSGADLLVGASIATAEIENSAVTTAKIADDAVTVAKVATAVYQAGSHVLSSGSRWVTFGTAFATTNYHITCSASVGIAAEPYSAIATGSKTIGSFIALGSPASAVFDWIAVGRK